MKNYKINVQVKKLTENIKKQIEDNVDSFMYDTLEKLNGSIDRAVQDYTLNQDDYAYENYVDDIRCEKEKKGSSYSFTIYVGENSSVETKNGELVNFFYFLNYGFGVVGKVSHTSSTEWEYDVNNHDLSGWFYKVNDYVYYTLGIVGFNFIEDTYDYIKANAKKQITKGIGGNK